MMGEKKKPLKGGQKWVRKDENPTENSQKLEGSMDTVGEAPVVTEKHKFHTACNEGKDGLEVEDDCDGLDGMRIGDGLRVGSPEFVPLTLGDEKKPSVAPTGPILQIMGQPTLGLDLEIIGGEMDSCKNNQLVVVTDLNEDGLSEIKNRITVINEGAQVEKFISNVSAALAEKEVDEAQSEGEPDRDKLKDDMRKDYCSDSEKPWKTRILIGREAELVLLQRWKTLICASKIVVCLI
ncbi:hypothetical protein F2P56_016190 [Juglans regia]|uniref:Uncharacterized protein LOC108983998 n=2 Tax=Juglans regia TaxID=51240 RepID=A0A2I4DW35_JUGRE|nr:uncharacterized protein LOC108983998 [Juglans regia]KAF5466245.1 hypothetical protein F2P56_016190 [Juglans regia]